VAAGVRGAAGEAGVARAVSDEVVYDVVVIGSGARRLCRGDPRGASSARRPRSSSARVSGGICPNWGCIPTKALLRTAEGARDPPHAQDFGIKVGSVEADSPRSSRAAVAIADKVSKGVAFLMKKNKIDVVTGTGKLLASRRRMEATPGRGSPATAGKRTLSAKHVADRDRRARSLAPRHRARWPADHRVSQGDDAADAAEVPRGPRRGRDRRRVRVVLSRARHRGHDRRVHAAPRSERGSRDQQGARARVCQARDQDAARSQADVREGRAATRS